MPSTPPWVGLTLCFRMCVTWWRCCQGEYVAAPAAEDDDEDAPKPLVWRGGAVVPSTTPAKDLTRAPLPPATA